MSGPRTLKETRRRVEDDPSAEPLDYTAMTVASSLLRAANTVRHHVERTVLASHALSWTAYVVLWIAWVWQPVETRQIAEEGGFSKATLSGVLDTLERRGLVARERGQTDGRLVVVSLTDAGRELIAALVPAVNEQERDLLELVEPAVRSDFAHTLTVVANGIPDQD